MARENDEEVLMDERDFLNSPKAGGMAAYNFRIAFQKSRAEFEDGRVRHWRTIDTRFEIRDCSRSIFLEFDAGDYEPLEDRLEKVEKLYQAMKRFRDTYKKAAKMYRADERANPDKELKAAA